jgi:hypothetical protein
MTMTDPDMPEADRYLELCERRVVLWERAETPRQEHEQAEAFTRAFAELSAHLADGGVLPRKWARAKPSIPLEPIPASEMPRIITDDIALNMAADVLDAMEDHRTAQRLRAMLPEAEGRVFGQPYQEQTGKWGSGQDDEETGQIWPVQELLGGHTVLVPKGNEDSAL